jgi:hypothetical protein
VDITSPADGSTVTKGQKYTITASASDPQGIRRVYFYVDNSNLNLDMSAPYSATWTVPANAKPSYLLRALVDDNKYCHSEASIIVNTAPAVQASANLDFLAQAIQSIQASLANIMAQLGR